MYTKCEWPALLAEAIYTYSTPRRVMGILKITKQRLLNTSVSAVDGKASTFWWAWPEFKPHFPEFFFSLFKSHIAFIFNINEGNNQQVEDEVSGMCREGFIVPIRWHPFNSLIWIETIIYIQFVIIVYCFIMH